MAPHENRSRLTVSLGANWRIYSNTLPAGTVALGTVCRGETDTGALGQIEATGLYVQINAGTVRTLDQRKIAAALADARATHGGPGRGQGRTAADGATDTYRVNVSIDAESDAIAKRLGNGDRSLGIRNALKLADQA